jgi:hypothetical protein
MPRIDDRDVRPSGLSVNAYLSVKPPSKAIDKIHLLELALERCRQRVQNSRNLSIEAKSHEPAIVLHCRVRSIAVPTRATSCASGGDAISIRVEEARLTNCHNVAILHSAWIRHSDAHVTHAHA